MRFAPERSRANAGVHRGGRALFANLNTFDLIERLESVKLTRGDRLIAESAARVAGSAVEVLCCAGAKVGSALALVSHLNARQAE